MEKADGLSAQYTGKTVHENISPLTNAASTIIDKAAYDAKALAAGAKYSVDVGPEEKQKFDQVREITSTIRPKGTHGCPLTEITPGVYTCHFKDIDTPESIPNLGKNIGLVVNSSCPHFQNDTYPGYCNTYPGFYGPDVQVCNIDLLDDPKVTMLLCYDVYIYIYIYIYVYIYVCVCECVYICLYVYMITLLFHLIDTTIYIYIYILGRRNSHIPWRC